MFENHENTNFLFASFSCKLEDPFSLSVAKNVAFLKYFPSVYMYSNPQGLVFYFFFFLIISFLDFMSRIAVIWISSPELSYVCHTYAMPICAPMWAENS